MLKDSTFERSTLVAESWKDLYLLPVLDGKGGQPSFPVDVEGIVLEAPKGRDGMTFRRFGMAIEGHEESGILRAAYGAFKTFAQELGFGTGTLM